MARQKAKQKKVKKPRRSAFGAALEPLFQLYCQRTGPDNATLFRFEATIGVDIARVLNGNRHTLDSDQLDAMLAELTRLGFLQADEVSRWAIELHEVRVRTLAALYLRRIDPQIDFSAVMDDLMGVVRPLIELRGKAQHLPSHALIPGHNVSHRIQADAPSQENATSTPSSALRKVKEGKQPLSRRETTDRTRSFIAMVAGPGNADPLAESSLHRALDVLIASQQAEESRNRPSTE